MKSDADFASMIEIGQQCSSAVRIECPVAECVRLAGASLVHQRVNELPHAVMRIRYEPHIAVKRRTRSYCAT